jgi:iron complex transport system permease protein
MTPKQGGRTPTALGSYGRLLRRRALIVALLGLVCLAGLFIDVSTGPSSLGFLETIKGILQPSSLSRANEVIIWQIRLPVAVMAPLVGIALALAGAEMQTILNNSLASPFTLGVSSAAAFGAALAIVLGIGIPGIPDSWLVTGNAFLFALGSVLLLQAAATRVTSGVDALVLFGIGLVFTFNAAVALLQFVASADALQQLVFWSMGSLSRSNWSAIGVLVTVIACVTPFALAASWKMTALRLGEERALSFGINVYRLRFFSLLRISLLAATAVAFVGTIGFIGLIGPHIARMLIGEDHRFLLPASALTGAAVMSFASIISKLMITGVVIPIGVVTAFVGLPVFFMLVFRQGRRL